MFLLHRKKTYKPDDVPEANFTAYIIKGNRQLIQRTVIASKRFRVDEETYLIKPECIFLKNIDGMLRSVSYYREGNPNPYNFTGDNTGVSADELDRIFAEDFYNIVTNLEPENKMVYVLLVVIINFALALTFTIGVAIHAFT